MGTILAILSVAFLLAFVVGLFKPSAVKMPNRKRAALIYFGGSMVFSVIGSKVDPLPKTMPEPDAAKPAIAEKKAQVKEFKYADVNLGDYKNEPKQTRHDIVDNFNAFKQVAPESTENMYACLSQYSFTSAPELKLNEVLGWCYSAYERSPSSLSENINFDSFQENFSPWDGSYRPLEKMIQESMNDDSSYDHVSTTYRLVLNKDQHAIVRTVFRGKNAFGAIMKNSVTARVNIKTGEIEKILN
ncbi:hypothetical protein PSNIH1_03200 [Pantoea sp. PSNIH1]|nr:hypothetical protein PSNIH1_03200 [Pantoea sp. PSNIH1]